ncbi:MAG: FecR family protein [Bacteroidetes bacterium]|nr:FecR family protein [Bacteroidota bacterium]
MKQLESNYHIASLIAKNLQGELSLKESMQLEEWKKADSKNSTLFETLNTESWQKEALQQLETYNKEEGWSELNQKIINTSNTVPAKRISLKTWLSVAAAACLILSIGLVWMQINRTTSGEKRNSFSKNPINIAPGSRKAILTQADGSEIVLNDSANYLLKQQKGLNVQIQGGEIKYQSTAPETGLIFNKVSTPRGGEYKLVLEDGTIAWLNAASSLKYPTVFNGKERIVELTGEGYFEVAHNALKPFKVQLPGIGMVEAIGTKFNIDAYQEEDNVKATLLEGKVRINSTIQSSFLTPGQQGLFLSNGLIKLNENVDMNEAFAWKNGQFIFKSLTINQIMRQISRWYNIDVSYKGNISTETFSGIVSRNSDLSGVLKVLEESGVKFKIEDKKILVY